MDLLDPVLVTPSLNMSDDFLSLNVKPHVIEDLGVNLYTSLSKALVEFIANAHDADATYAKIVMNSTAIKKAREVARQTWELGRTKGIYPDGADSLERMRLEGVSIIIEDDGNGMTRGELQEKFLDVGRRRRGEDVRQRSPGNRVIMGRKGLGKLAGFGIAHKMVVTSKSTDNSEDEAWEISLDFDQMMGAPSTGEIKIPIRRISSDEWNGSKDGGTVITLSKLTYSGTAGAQTAAINNVAEYFRMVNVDEFAIWNVDGPDEDVIDAEKRTYIYGYPDPEEEDYEKLSTVSIQLGDGATYPVSFRIRFTPPKGQLKDRERGIRVYAHGRLAAAPSLFDVKSSANGYKYTSYMDGVCVADFIDEQPIDYIATDRQGLRWETQFLKPLQTYFQEAITNALNEFAKSRDESADKEVRSDLFTKKTIDEAKLPKHRAELAYRIAVVLAKASGDRTKAPYYQQALPLVVKGIGKGDILDTMASLAGVDLPDLSSVISEITELTKQEFGDFLSFVQGRLDGIMALKKICKDQNFRKSNNEKELQKLFEANPWLIDPTFFQFLSADQQRSVVNIKLAERLKIGNHVPDGYDPSVPDEKDEEGLNRRPDLVFLLNNDALGRIVIVELKAPNTSLHHDHLIQLQNYIRMTEEWLEEKYRDKKYNVTGMLIGCRNPDSQASKVKQLRYAENKRTDGENWNVYDVFDVLNRSEDAHRELVEIYDNADGAVKQP